MKKQEIINQLEMDELKFVKSLLSQLQDNSDDLALLAHKANDPESNITNQIVVFEIIRLSERTEDIYNLLRHLLNAADNNVERAIQSLIESEVKMNDHLCK